MTTLREDLMNEAINNAEQVRSYKREKSYSKYWLCLFMLAGAVILLFAMHGDQQALRDGFIH